MLNLKTIKKLAVMLMCVVMMLVMFALTVSAASTNGYLDVYVHYVPILKDTATAITTTDYDFSSNDGSDLWTNTTVYAYKGSEYAKNQGEFSGVWCVDGAGQSVEAKIRSIDKARGYHSGGGNRGSASCSTSWNK